MTVLPRRLAGVPLLLALLATLPLASCGATPRRYFGNAFYAPVFSYRVRFLGRVDRARLLPRAWLLDNWWRPAPDEPLQMKFGDTVSFALDTNNDGRFESRAVEPRSDLRFVHRSDGSSIWLRGIPLGWTLHDRALDVIAHDYVDRIAGGNYFDVSFGNTIEAHEEHLGTRIVEEGPATIGGQRAWICVFDILSLEQRQVSAAHVGDRVEIAFFRSGAHGWRPEQDAPPGEWPVVIVAGYAARGENFPAHRADFESLLGRIDLMP